MNLTSIREAIADQFSSFSDLTASTRIPASSEITCPHAFISDMAMRFVAMGDAADMDFEVTVLLSLADNQTGWEKASELWDVDSGTSIVDALLSDRTLNGTVSSLTFGELRNLGSGYDVASVFYLGFQMTFTAHVA